MNRAQQIFLAAAFALGLSGGIATAAPMNEYFPTFATASDVQVVILDAQAKANKEYKFMTAQPEIYAAEAKAVIAKTPALAAKLRSMNVQINNIAGIVSSEDGTYTVLLR